MSGSSYRVTVHRQHREEQRSIWRETAEDREEQRSLQENRGASGRTEEPPGEQRSLRREGEGQRGTEEPPGEKAVDIEEDPWRTKGRYMECFSPEDAARLTRTARKMTHIRHPDPLYPGKMRPDSFFCEGKFLRNDEVREALGESLPSRGGGSQQSFLGLEEMWLTLDPPHFPITCLKHVTTLENFRNIVNEGAIRGFFRRFLLQGSPVQLPVSCWSPHISLQQVENFKSQRFDDFMQRYSWRTSLYEEPDLTVLEVRDMMATSPALRPDSRYGNLQFTSRLEELLRLYSEQHCGGYNPVLRVLGTEAYKLEVVHWVLIHSPYVRYFDHLPQVDSVWPRSRAGNLMWAPESTTDLYTWFVDPFSGGLLKYPRELYHPSRWNNVVFAFHLPGGRALRLGRGTLLGSVEACETAKSLWGDGRHILRHPINKYIPKEDAEYYIREEREKASSVWQ